MTEPTNTPDALTVCKIGNGAMVHLSAQPVGDLNGWTYCGKQGYIGYPGRNAEVNCTKCQRGAEIRGH